MGELATVWGTDQFGRIDTRAWRRILEVGDL